MKLTRERRSMDFRKETFEIIFHFYLCEDSQEQFTTTALDELNINQIYNQYRQRFNIPFPNEIAKIRHKYGLSAVKMSEVLGFGVNTYRQYEAGEMPVAANARLIQMADDPRFFLDMVQLCATINSKSKEKILQRARLIQEENNRNQFEHSFKEYLLGNHVADVYTGYRKPSLDKLAEMVVYFSEKMEPFKTKMNKLLFYADFLMFKESCFSISGTRYKAINLGPAPNNYQSIFEYLCNREEIEVKTTEVSGGYAGEQFLARKNRPFRAEVFSDSELVVLDKVAAFFDRTSTSEIVEFSHLEAVWAKNITEKRIISYEYAFDLVSI
jgi:DNA-binding transcriptional regulator YiaG